MSKQKSRNDEKMVLSPKQKSRVYNTKNCFYPQRAQISDIHTSLRNYVLNEPNDNPKMEYNKMMISNEDMISTLKEKK